MRPGFDEFLRSRGYGEAEIESALRSVGELEAHLSARGSELDKAVEEDIREYFDHLIGIGGNSLRTIVDLARYFYFAGLHDPYIYILSTVNGREVLDSISEKLVEEMGTDCRERVFRNLEKPPLGSPPETYVRNTATLVERLLDEGTEACHCVLADNHHGIPRSSFDRMAKLYAASSSIDDFLEELHDLRVSELQEHADRKKPWFEQEITQEVVDMVRNNPEILSAVRKGDYLYFTKIPYAPAEWLEEDDPVRRRYLACHCPLAREAILMEDVSIPLDWCYCSGGFGKWMYDVLFNEETEVEVLESVLAGHDRCRFRIRLP